MKQQVARYFEDEVADEENAGTQTVGGVAELQRTLHLKLREADVDAVKVGGDVADEEQRNQPHADLAVDRVRF